MLFGMWLEDACLDLRSTIDQSLTIYCLREESLIDLNGLACKLLPAAVLDECMYWRRRLVGCCLICSLLCISLSTCAKCNGVTSLRHTPLCSLTNVIKRTICLNYKSFFSTSFQLFHLYSFGYICVGFLKISASSTIIETNWISYVRLTALRIYPTDTLSFQKNSAVT